MARLRRGLAGILVACCVTMGSLTVSSPSARAADCESYVYGDINCDWRTDWAVGVPNASTNRGKVEWRLGGEQGFGTVTAASLGFAASAAGDRFGTSVLVDDVTGDGYADLLIGAPGHLGRGAVYVEKGSPTGIVAAGARLIAAPAIAATTSAKFGEALGVLRHSGTVQSLVVGAPGWDSATRSNAGAVFTAPLSSDGTAGAWTKYAQPVGQEEAGDAFGAPLAVRGTTAMVGSPKENVGSLTDAGQVTVIRWQYGTAWSVQWSRVIHQDTSGVPGAASAYDHFGAAVSIGQRNMYVAGIPDENIGSDTNTGAVQRFYLDDTGTATYLPRLHQDSAGVPGAGEDGDQWGAAVAAGYDWWDEVQLLFVGAPGEGVGSKSKAGAVTYLRGDTAVTGVFLEQGAELPGAAESGDKVGATLSLYPDDDEEDSVDGITIGVPGEDLGSVADAGLVILDEGLLSMNFVSYPALGGAVAGQRFGSVLAAVR